MYVTEPDLKGIYAKVISQNPGIYSFDTQFITFRVRVL
jgi:hypothetical protein